MPKTITTTWDNVLPKDLEGINFIFDRDTGTITCEAEYNIKSGGSYIKRNRIPITLTAAVKTSLLGFVNATVIPQIHTFEGYD